MKLFRKRSLLLFSFFLCFCFFSTSALSYGMVIAPSTINLNTECVGKNQDVQAIISEPIPGTLASGVMDLYISSDGGKNWSFILSTETIRYCYIDYNFLISFDRCELQDILLTNLNLKCPINVIVWVSGYYFLNGSDEMKYLEGYDYNVDIIKPGGKK